MCAAGALRHGAVGASSGRVPPAEEAGGGALWRGVGGPVDGREQEGGHQDAQTRYWHQGENVEGHGRMSQTDVDGLCCVWVSRGYEAGRVCEGGPGAEEPPPPKAHPATGHGVPGRTRLHRHRAHEQGEPEVLPGL